MRFNLRQRFISAPIIIGLLILARKRISIKLSKSLRTYLSLQSKPRLKSKLMKTIPNGTLPKSKNSQI
jgi:hypothetical protein